MKLNSLSVLCLLLLVFHIPFSLTRGGSKSSGSRSGWFGSSSKTTYSSKHGKSPTNHKKSQSNSQSTAPKQSSNNQQRSRVSYPQTGMVVHGRYGTPGGYPGGYINQNPNNKVLSPHYAGSFGYGGYHTWGGSPFSHRISELGLRPSASSKGFGHRAAEAAAQVTIARMALGYGLGRFPRPHFHFHDSQQECHYNQYMYRKYGTRSNNVNDYSRDYVYNPSSQAQTYDSYMKTCMWRTDLLPAKSKKPLNKPAKTKATEAVSSVSESETVRNTTKADGINSTVNTENSKASTLPPLNQFNAEPAGPASLVASGVEDDDTVSIVEIGYPALIEQMKARRCLELYLDYSEQYMKSLHGRVERLKIEFQGLLAAVIGTTLMLHNSNMLPN